MSLDFSHQQSAHCESGVASALLKHAGLEISEPMAFGLASALAFAYIPFIKLNGLPLIAYRMPPKFILKGIQKRLNVKFQFTTFRSPEAGMDALDQALDEKKIIGMQASVYWLPYIPDDMRFHFNAHNLIVYGREGNTYKVSDPVVENKTQIEREHLMKSRFAKGALAPKGLMYTLESIPQTIDYPKAIKKAIRSNIKTMLEAPVPVIGTKGIHFLARKIPKLENKLGTEKKVKLWLGHMVRMQEEIGTGGAGFRFIYASFLQQSSLLIKNDSLAEASQMMTNTGDLWRKFALHTAQICKGKKEMDLLTLSETLHEIAEQETEIWRFLKKAN